MPTPRRYYYEYWDVFTRTPFKGNPLCVFLDARGLSDSEMLALARETNLSETTFVFPNNRVRIFTPTEELPFAGHPTLGTAMALRKPGDRGFVLHENIGPIPVRFEVPAEIPETNPKREAEFVFAEMTQTDPVFAESHPPETIARLLNLAPSDLAPSPIQTVSTGRPNLIVVLNSLKTLRSLNPDWPAIRSYLASGDPQRGFYFLAFAPGNAIHARKLSARSEDPVTGSAAGCAAAYLVLHGIAPPGKRFVIQQGADVHREGELHVTASIKDKKVVDVRVGGYCVRTFRGELTL